VTLQCRVEKEHDRQQFHSGPIPITSHSGRISGNQSDLKVTHHWTLITSHQQSLQTANDNTIR